MRGVFLVFLVACGDNAKPAIPDASGHSGDVPSFELLSLSPLTVDFGGVNIGCTATAKTFTVTNTGTGAGSALGVALFGSAASAFAIADDTCSGTPLAAGASCTFAVGTVVGGPVGAKSASVQVTGSSSVSAALDATYLSASPILVTPASIAFPITAVGAISTAMTVTVTDGGCPNAGPLTVALDGNDPGMFTVGGTCAGHMLADGPCTIDVAFAPTSNGTRAAALTISSNVDSVVVPLSGPTPPAKLVITPTLQDFGTVAIGCPGTSVSFTLSNIGGVTSGSIATTLGGADATSFAIGSDACNGATLAPGASCVITAAFHPSSPGSRAATLTAIATGGGVATATLQGTGSSPGALTINPTTLSFGMVAVGATSSPMSVVLTNQGCTTTPPLAVGLAGNDPLSFAIASDTCTGATVTPGQSCSVGIAFAPTTAGPRSANLSISGGAVSTSAGLAGTGQ